MFHFYFLLNIYFTDAVGLFLTITRILRISVYDFINILRVLKLYELQQNVGFCLSNLLNNIQFSN
jgi:hypothetical protein